MKQWRISSNNTFQTFSMTLKNSDSWSSHCQKSPRCLQRAGSFGNVDGNDKENVTCMRIKICDYPILFAFYNIGEVR